MSKVHNTRKQKAARLVKLAIDGPSFALNSSEEEERYGHAAARLYKLWSESWLLPLIRELVPELRAADRKKESGQ